MPRTSLDEVIRLSILEHFAALMTLASFDPTLVMDRFNIPTGCIKVKRSSGDYSRVRGACNSVRCVSPSRLSVVDPTSSVVDVRQRYPRVFPSDTKFDGPSFYRSLGTIHYTPTPDDGLSWSNWQHHEHATFAQALARFVQSEYQKRREVPDWIIKFVFHFLSQDPLFQHCQRSRRPGLWCLKHKNHDFG